MRSYSHIFTTLATEEEIDEIFDVDTHPLLEKKAGIITSYYRRLLKPEVTKRVIHGNGSKCVLRKLLIL